jgi:hypothetical protein
MQATVVAAPVPHPAPTADTDADADALKIMTAAESQWLSLQLGGAAGPYIT